MLELITWLAKNKTFVAAMSAVIWLGHGRYVLDTYNALQTAHNGVVTLYAAQVESVMVTLIVLCLSAVATAVALLMEVKLPSRK